MFFNLGFDSSSGHLNPQQKSNDPENVSKKPTQSLMVTSATLLCLNYGESQWLTKEPQDVRWCRPLRIALEDENEQTIQREYDRIRTEIDKLEDYCFTTQNGSSAKVSFVCYTCAFDGKCVNAIVKNKATSRCPVCLKSVYQFGTYSSIIDDFKPETEAMNLGVGLLHCLIRSFEHLLHLSYRLPIMSWDVRAGEMRGKKILFKL